MGSNTSRVLITGGAGYIGSVLVGQLLQSNYPVRVLDNLTFGGNALLPYVNHPGFEFVKADICQKKDLKQALNGIDTIIHLAAIVGDPACKKNPDLARKVNKEGAELLGQLALSTNVKRFIFASTCSNYGKMSDADEYVDENSPLKPVSLYAKLKVEFENYLMNLFSDNFTPICLRFATAYGLSPRPRFDLTLNEFTKEILLGRTLEIYGENFWRPYCHTVDLARACIMAMETDRSLVAYQAFNVGDDKENYQKKTLIDMILSELPQMKENVHFVHRDEDPRDYKVNFNKIKTVLGFSISKKVIDGIREYIHAIKSGLIKNPDDNLYRNI